MIAKSFPQLFHGFSKRHGSYKLTERKGSKFQGVAMTVEGAPTAAEWDNHLAGKGAGLGMIPLMDDNENACFGCIDIDRYDLDFNALERDTAQLPVVITKSKSGGAHVWLFTQEPVPASLIQEKLSEWAGALGFGGCEIFPKQTRRQSDTDVGNWINLPYFGDSRKCWLEGVETSFEQFMAHVQTRLMNEETLHAIKLVTNELFSDGPPCLQSLHGNIIPGTRNIVMFNVGLYFKRRDPETWKDNLVRYNLEHMAGGALGNDEIQTLIKSLERKEYSYQCDVSPLCQKCNKRQCLKREFGITGSQEINVMLTGLTKLNSQPPLWFVDVDGVRIELDSIDRLMNLQRFRIVCAEVVHKVLPSTIKAVRWDKTVQTLLDSLQVVEAPEDAGIMGTFKHYLEQFIEIRGQDESRDRLTNGNAWIDGEHVYFRSPDLQEYLNRQHFKELSTQQVWNILREQYAAEKGKFNLKGLYVNYWKLRFSNMQREANDVPNISDAAI